MTHISSFNWKIVMFISKTHLLPYLQSEFHSFNPFVTNTVEVKVEKPLIKHRYTFFSKRIKY